MPVPGPRTQFGPLSGYRNPEVESPDKFNHWHRPGPIAMQGRSPGLMEHNIRGMVLAAGQIRRVWRQAINFTGAQAAFSWTSSAPGAGGPVVGPPGYFVTRALRYMARSVYAQAGTDETRFLGMHSQIKPRVRSKAVSVPAGGVRNRPTVRNRLSSFGSRVPPLNPKLPAGQ